MPDWPTLPAGAGYPLVDATTGEFLSDAVNDALSDVVETEVAAVGVLKESAALQVVGDGDDPNASTTQNVKLLVTANRTNPTQVIEQHFVGFSFYSGTPGGSVGTLQGGSSESYAFANGSSDMGTVLGFEGVGRGDGDNGSRSIATVIGLQGTAVVDGSPAVPLLVSVRARGPERSSGSGSVAESRSLDIQEPVTGTIRRSLFGIGAHHFRKGTATNAVEIANAGETLQWANDGSKWRGYASDGTSERIVLDPGDGATARATLSYFTSGAKGLAINNINSGGLGDAIEYVRDGQVRFVVNTDGTMTKIGGEAVSILSGGGSPEGVFGAPVGSIYLRTGGGAGTSLYVKESGGSGGTGWVAK